MNKFFLKIVCIILITFSLGGCSKNYVSHHTDNKFYFDSYIIEKSDKLFIYLVDDSFESVFFYVWSDINEQDDLHSFRAIEKNGIYYYIVDLNDFNDTGVYLIHAYVKCGKDYEYYDAITNYVEKIE